MSNFKRSAATTDGRFHREHKDCFACSDTGIVQNGDGLVNKLPGFEDYDIQNGRIARGSDLALICTCKAAYPKYEPDGSCSRGGYRTPDGIRTVEVAGRSCPMGAEISVELVNQLHKDRLELWKQADREFNQYRERAAAGVPAELPEYLKLARQAMSANTGEPPVAVAGFSTIGQVLNSIPVPTQVFSNADDTAQANLEPEPCGGPGVLPGRPPVSVPGGVGQPFHHHRGERQDAGADGPDHVDAF